MSFSLAFLRTSECIEIGSLQLAKKFAVNTVQHETELQTKHELQYTDFSLDLTSLTPCKYWWKKRHLQPANEDGKHPTENVKRKRYNLY